MMAVRFKKPVAPVALVLMVLALLCGTSHAGERAQERKTMLVIRLRRGAPAQQSNSG